jgi:hypothetical protein
MVAAAAPVSIALSTVSGAAKGATVAHFPWGPAASLRTAVSFSSFHTAALPLSSALHPLCKSLASNSLTSMSPRLSLTHCAQWVIHYRGFLTHSVQTSFVRFVCNSVCKREVTQTIPAISELRLVAKSKSRNLRLANFSGKIAQPSRAMRNGPGLGAGRTG